MIMREQKVTTEMMLNAAKVDALNTLIWMQTKDGAKGRNRPTSMMGVIMGAKEETDMVETFDTAADFEARRKAILEGVI